MITKTTIAGRVAAGTGLSKTAAGEAVDAVFDAITAHATRGEDVIIQGFGTFRVRDRAARDGRNPSTGEPVQIPAARTVKLRLSPALRDRLNPKRMVGSQRNSPAAARKRA